MYDIKNNHIIISIRKNKNKIEGHSIFDLTLSELAETPKRMK